MTRRLLLCVGMLALPIIRFIALCAVVALGVIGFLTLNALESLCR